MKKILLLFSLIMASCLLASAGTKKTPSHKQSNSLLGKTFIIQKSEESNVAIFFQFLSGNQLVTGSLNNTSEQENGCDYLTAGSYYYSPKTGLLSMTFDGGKIKGVIYWINSQKLKIKQKSGSVFLAEAYSDYDVTGSKFKDALNKLMSFELKILGQ